MSTSCNIVIIENNCYKSELCNELTLNKEKHSIFYKHDDGGKYTKKLLLNYLNNFARVYDTDYLAGNLLPYLMDNRSRDDINNGACLGYGVTPVLNDVEYIYVIDNYNYNLIVLSGYAHPDGKHKYLDVISYGERQ